MHNEMKVGVGVPCADKGTFQQPRLPQHSPCPTESTLHTLASSPGNSSKEGSPVIRGKQAENSQAQICGTQSQPREFKSEPSIHLMNAATANGTCDEKDENSERRLSSFSKFMDQIGQKWAELGTETNSNRRKDSLKPNEDISLYPHLDALHASGNQASYTEMEQAVRNPSESQIFLEKFLISHQEKMKTWKQQQEQKRMGQSSTSITQGSNNLDQSSQSHTSRMDRSDKSLGIDRSTRSHNSANSSPRQRNNPVSPGCRQRQRQLEFAQKYNGSQRLSTGSTDSKLDGSIFDLFEQQRQEKRHKPHPPSTRHAPRPDSKNIPSRDSSINSNASSAKTPFEQLYEKTVLKNGDQKTSIPSRNSSLNSNASSKKTPFEQLQEKTNQKGRQPLIQKTPFPPTSNPPQPSVQRTRSNPNSISTQHRAPPRKTCSSSQRLGGSFSRVISNERRMRLSANNQIIAEAMLSQRTQLQQPPEEFQQQPEEEIRWKRKPLSAANQKLAAAMRQQAQQRQEAMQPVSESIAEAPKASETVEDSSYPAQQAKELVEDSSYPAQQAKELIEMTSRPSDLSATTAAETTICQRADLERSITAEFLAPPESTCEQQQSGKNRNASAGDVMPGAYRAAPGKSCMRNQPVRHSVISKRSLSAQMSSAGLDYSDSFSPANNNTVDSWSGSASVGAIPNPKRRPPRRNITAESKKSVEEVVFEEEHENSASEISEHSSSDSSVGAVAAGGLLNEPRNSRDDLYERKMAAALVFKSSETVGTKGSKGSMSPKSETGVHLYERKMAAALVFKGSTKEGAMPSEGAMSPRAEATDDWYDRKMAAALVFKGSTKEGAVPSKRGSASQKSETLDGSHSTRRRQHTEVRADSSEDEKEEIVSLDESAEDTVPPLRPFLGNAQSGVGLSHSGGGNGGQHRLRNQAPAASRLNETRLGDWLSGSTSTQGRASNKSKLSSVYSELSLGMDDSGSNVSAVSELQRRVDSMASRSSSASAAAQQSAERIARNMSIYMRGGALPVAATVVDDDGVLEAELREQLEKEIRQELEIEMEDFRRRMLAQVFSAAEPVTADVISIRQGEQDCHVNVESDNAVTFQAELLERERAEAAAIRSNMNEALGRMYMAMKKSRSAFVEDGEPEQEHFYDEELAEMTRIIKQNDPTITTWRSVWLVLVIALFSGLVLGMGMMSAMQKSKGG